MTNKKDQKKQKVTESKHPKWTEEVRNIKDLVPYERNPRKITESQYEKLNSSIEQFGYASRILITPIGKIIGGHQRLRALKDQGYKEVPVLVFEREMSYDEYHKFLVIDNIHSGEFDNDILSSLVDAELLGEVGSREHKDLVHGIMEAENPKPPKSHVRCPECMCEFPVKGNKVQT